MSVKVGYRQEQLMMNAAKCECGTSHSAITQDIFVGTGLIARLPELIQRRELGKICVLVSDGSAAEACDAVRAALTAEGFKVADCAYDRGADLLPDERALGELLMSMGMETEFFIAVGGAVATDIARAVAAQTERPLACVPTAPSTSGYVGFGARLLRGGQPIVLPAICPELVACDLDVLGRAPIELFAAGVMDMIGKFTARTDWCASGGARRDPYCPELAQVVVGAANRVLKNIGEIAARSASGVRTLTESLLLCGIASVCAGHSRPVSGSEQLIADAWTESLLAEGLPLPPRGQLVGASALALLDRCAALAGTDAAATGLPDADRIRAAIAPLGAPLAMPDGTIEAARARLGKPGLQKYPLLRAAN